MNKPGILASQKTKKNYQYITAMKKIVNPDPSEKEILESVFIDLALMANCIMYDRLNSGRARAMFGSSVIRLCRPGTADAYCIIKKGTLGHLFFIETKTPKGNMRTAQQDFREAIMGMNNIHYLIIRKKGEVRQIIEERINDQSI